MFRTITQHCIPIVPVALVALACNSDEGTETTMGEANQAYFEILNDTVYDVILPSYESLKKGAETLAKAVEVLESDTTDHNLDAARDAWVAARSPWEQSEAFLFGPVSQLGLDPALDTWPLDRVQLEQVIESELTLTPEHITENLGGGLKGFHTIEYLLWGVDGATTAADLAAAPRELEYLVAATHALSSDATTLHAAWADDGDAFGRRFVLSGQEGGLYFSEQDGMQQLINGMVNICDEVANGKIADPYDEQSTELVESQFSFNSIRDFADNIRSVQHVYQGMGDNPGATVSSYVASQNAAIDEGVRDAIQTAIDAVHAISPNNDPPFRDAITDLKRANAIEEAQEAIRTVMDMMAGDVTTLVLE